MIQKSSFWIGLVIILFTQGVAMVQNTDLYHEPYRPQFHYSPPCNWMNDPNGLVYDEGEYHLFYQHYPDDVTAGPMHWGHAVSTDLIHWQTLPIALYPDEIGPIWSGSIVADRQNTSGLIPDGGLVALYSYQNQSQGLAYSSDHGRTWTKYAGNPVIEARAKDFRDPKVFWHDDTGQWVMVLAAGSEVQIFTSTNLLDWEYRSRFTNGDRRGVWEVPDLFPLEIEGQTKWVLLVALTPAARRAGTARSISSAILMVKPLPPTIHMPLFGWITGRIIMPEQPGTMPPTTGAFSSAG
jgi:fructan beta-fructosidase